MKKNCYCLIISFFAISASCNKHFDCRGTVHSFEAFFKAYPDRDSIHVNDTIWIELKTPTHLKDLTTNQEVDYSEAANLGTVIRYAELLGGNVLNPGAIGGANHFDNIHINGSPLEPLKPEEERVFNFKEENSMYLFKVGIVPKKQGVFLIGMGNADNVYQKDNNCRKSNFRMTFKETNQHLNLLEESRPGYTPSEYEREHVYCFKVY